MPNRFPRPAGLPMPRYPADPLRAFSRFKQGKDPAHISLKRLVKRLEKHQISHAVMGGMAVYAHGYRRFTDDVDVLVTKQGLEAFRRLFVPKFYEPVPGRARWFYDRKNGIRVDLLLTGMFPGMGDPGPFAFPDPEHVRELIGKVHYINLKTLIELKLAARRYQDFADVVNLIQANNLDESYLPRLHPSVRQDFIECLEEKRREEENEAKYGGHGGGP